MDARTARFLAGTVAESRRRLACQHGHYRVWRSPGGAEVWMHFSSSETAQFRGLASGGATGDAMSDLAGLTITHHGPSEMPLRLMRLMPVNPRNPLEGVAIGLAASRRDGEKPLALSFELTGFATETLDRPRDVRVRMTALAQRVWAHVSEADLLRQSPPHRLMGVGGIADMEPNDLPDVSLIYRPMPGTYWLISGTVRRSARLINVWTGLPYALISVETDRGMIDVVANPSVIAGDISDGHVLQAAVVLTGRLIA